MTNELTVIRYAVFGVVWPIRFVARYPASFRPDNVKLVRSLIRFRRGAGCSVHDDKIDREQQWNAFKSTKARRNIFSRGHK